MVTYRYGGFWRRFIAFSIDFFIISTIFFTLLTIATIAMIAGAMAEASHDFFALFTDPARLSLYVLIPPLFYTLIMIVYFTYFHGTGGRTPGKMLLNLNIYTREGINISYGTAFLRAVGLIISSMFFCLGFIWAAFDKKKQSWHDKIAGTVVVVKGRNISAGLYIPDPMPIAPPLRDEVKSIPDDRQAQQGKSAADAPPDFDK